MSQEQWTQHEAPPASSQYSYPERPVTNGTGRSPGESFTRQALFQLQHLPLSNFLALPRKPGDRWSDAVMWVAVSAIARIASRYLLSAVPFLSPIVTMVMLAPAILAIFLAVFVPKTGWIPFYRLFLIMVGLFIGGKFF